MNFIFKNIFLIFEYRFGINSQDITLLLPPNTFYNLFLIFYSLLLQRELIKIQREWLDVEKERLGIERERLHIDRRRLEMEEQAGRVPTLYEAKKWLQ